MNAQPRIDRVNDSDGPARGLMSKTLEALLTRREVLLAGLLIIVLATFSTLDFTGSLSASYDAGYLADSLISAIPLAMLAIAQLVVIVSGNGGIDLSVGSMVSLIGMVFGFAYGVWGWDFPAALALAMAVGTGLGLINGALIAYMNFSPLIATLATYYAFESIAMVIHHQRPIDSTVIQDFYSVAGSVRLPWIGRALPEIPLGILTFLAPVAAAVWVLLTRTTYGRRLYAVGTNDVAAAWTGVDVRTTRLLAYVLSGLICSLVAVFTVAEFASARPNAGSSGNGMALPSITIAVLGGVAITGGIGRVSGVILATLLIVWLDAGILLALPGNAGAQFQLLALGLILVLASLLNEATRKRYGGT